jgi:hypothetical protein
MEIDIKNMTGIIVLNSSHSMFMGNKPILVENEIFSKVIENSFSSKKQIDIERFGLFETATPNYTTYYPDVTADDLNPKDEDFIYPIFRALSATIVWKGYKPIDFSKDNGAILKESMDLLLNQTINADHETALGNGMGVVKSVFWDNGYTIDGVKVPAGINAEFMIDGKSNPRIARGILSNPPIIHSNSVSVRFSWEPSHTNIEMQEFWNKIGTFDDKGNLYRLVVNKVLAYTETSLVSHGADPYAQIVKNGKINNAKYASTVYSFSTTDDKGKNIRATHSIDYKMDLTLSLCSDKVTIPNLLFNKNTDIQENMKLLEILEEKFGLDKGKLNEENLSEQIDQFLQSKEDQITNLNNKVSEIGTEKENLTNQLNEVKPFKEKYELILTSRRNEALRLYKLAKGEGNVDETITNLISKSDKEVVESLINDYKKEVNLKFPESCQDCGSTNLSRRSSSDDGGEGGGSNTIKSNSEAKANLIDKAKKNRKKNNN